MMARKVYTAEFKREVVAMSYTTDKTLAQFAQDMGVHKSTLENWRATAKAKGADAFPGSGHQTPQDAQITRLKKELRQAQQERDILKKALTFFAQANP
jgi:transposase